MGMRTGILRIATTVRALGVGTAWIIWAAGIAIAIFSKRSDEFWFLVIASAVLGGLFYGGGKGLAWIIEGFAPERAIDVQTTHPSEGL